jgi:hypothetical protein
MLLIQIIQTKRAYQEPILDVVQSEDLAIREPRRLILLDEAKQSPRALGRVAYCREATRTV